MGTALLPSPASTESPTIETATNASSPPAFYTWAVPGKAIRVRLAFEVIDRMNIDIMQGFGAVPRRGAEVGGILLGRVEEGGASVLVEDFETVPCEHLYGPSYQLSEADRQRLAEALERRRSQSGPASGIVGLYRSHTRGKLALFDQDTALFAECCAGPADVFLLVRPYAARPGVAGFFIRENGRFKTDATDLEFAFERRALGGGPLPPPKPAAPPQPAAPAAPEPPVPSKSSVLRLFPVRSPGPSPIEERPDLRSQTVQVMPPDASSSLASSTKPRGNRLTLLPLSFIFMVVGLILGFQAALQVKPSKAPPIEELCMLDLAIVEHGPNLEVSWNRQSPAVLAARRGVLHIQDGDAVRDMDLDATALRTNTVTYYRTASQVRFRLEVYLASGASVSETRQTPVH